MPLKGEVRVVPAAGGVGEEAVRTSREVASRVVSSKVRGLERAAVAADVGADGGTNQTPAVALAMATAARKRRVARSCRSMRILLRSVQVRTTSIVHSTARPPVNDVAPPSAGRLFNHGCSSCKNN